MRKTQMLSSLLVASLATASFAGWKPLKNPDGMYTAAFGKLPEQSSPKWKNYAYKPAKTAKLEIVPGNPAKALVLDNEGTEAPAKFANYTIYGKSLPAKNEGFLVVDFKLKLLDEKSDKRQFCVSFALKNKEGRLTHWSYAFARNEIYRHMRGKDKVEVGSEWRDYRVIVNLRSELATMYMDGNLKPMATYQGYYYKVDKENPNLRFGDASGHVFGRIALASIAWKWVSSKYDVFTFDSSKALKAPGVLLTFDDHSIAHWVSALPIFARHNAKATFFIDRFDTLSDSQRAGLKKLRAAGHAIECHSMRHQGAVAFVRSHSLQAYLKSEIMPSVKLMRAAGFPVTAFAYPFSQHNKEIDEAMLKVFRHLRGGCPNKGRGLETIDAIFTPIQESGYHGFLTGTCVQPHSADDPLIANASKAFARASAREEIVVFYAHDIRNSDIKGPKNFITPDALDALLAKAESNGLKFYTFEDLP